ncbi:sodium:proton antiporter, partial [Amaricoccus sp. HAR-UPW-R2A-40]
MTVTRDDVLKALRRVALPEGGDLVGADLVRALAVEGAVVRFVIEVSPEKGRAYEAGPRRRPGGG